MSANEHSDGIEYHSSHAVDSPAPDAGVGDGYDSADSSDAWDEVDVHADNSAAALAAATAAAGNKELSITIATNNKVKGKK